MKNRFTKISRKISLLGWLAMVFFAVDRGYADKISSSPVQKESVQACLIPQGLHTKNINHAEQAACLDWHANVNALCYGRFRAIQLPSSPDGSAVQLQAKEVLFQGDGKSIMRGDVSVQQSDRIVHAQTAEIYRNAKTGKVERIVLFGPLRYLEPGRLMHARRATIYPANKTGEVNDAYYRFDFARAYSELPSWGQASRIHRDEKKDYWMENVSYSTCRPSRPAWRIVARTLHLDTAAQKGVARDAKFQVLDHSILYTPYLSFPTSNARKSGFLLPQKGYSNLGGYDISLPFYWNIAPNYDATLIPHYYEKRGLMYGAQFRYLLPWTSGTVKGHYLPSDKAFRRFLNENQAEFPFLAQQSTNRSSLQLTNGTTILPNLWLNIDYSQTSDPYYLQDFSSNLSTATERQLLQKGEAVYTTDHWQLSGVLQRYQTLNPINQPQVARIYDQKPQLQANGYYPNLPLEGRLKILGQYNYFHWGDSDNFFPDSGRAILTPQLQFPHYYPWGFISPGMDVVLRNYRIRASQTSVDQSITSSIPRFNLDAGLVFEKFFSALKQSWVHTIEPRLFYLYVPFEDQSNIRTFDSGYLIFNFDQLFRVNRFSGSDRIGDSNQLTYAITSRFLSGETGAEKLMLGLGQIQYFSKRRVKLCTNPLGGNSCIDSPLSIGYLPPDTRSSPVVLRAVYSFMSGMHLSGDYVWDPATRSTDNAHAYLRFKGSDNRLFNVGYSYLVNGDSSYVRNNAINDRALHQLSFTYAWPFSEHWSSLGGVNYNISKRYAMMGLFGVQYDSCCWAMRILGGQNFTSLNEQFRPQYNKNVYIQFLLKGLGSVGNSDPSSTIRTFVPGYIDKFKAP